MTRSQYVTKVKAIDTGTQYDPPKIEKQKQTVATSPTEPKPVKNLL